MQILPVSKQPKTTNPAFEAVNQKYLKRAQREFCRKGGTLGNILDCLTFDIYSHKLTFDDGIDTIEAIKNMAGKTDPYIEHVLEHFKKGKEINQ